MPSERWVKCGTGQCAVPAGPQATSFDALNLAVLEWYFAFGAFQGDVFVGSCRRAKLRSWCDAE